MTDAGEFPLTYQRDYDGENWRICEVSFGPGRHFHITTDHVHASALDEAEDEDYMRLFAAAPALLAACEGALIHIGISGAGRDTPLAVMSADAVMMRVLHAAIAEACGEQP